MVDTTAPMSLGAVVAVVGTILTWVLGGIAVWKFAAEGRKRRRDDDAHLEDLIERVCRAFTESDAYQLRRDRAMISVAQAVTEEAFRMRAPSFVDSDVDRERREQAERRLTVIETTLADLRSDFKAAAMSIAREVVRELREDNHR